MIPAHLTMKMMMCTALMLCSAGVAAAEAPLWVDDGRPGAQAVQAVQRLEQAASHGLEPQDYAAESLRRRVASALQGPPLAPAAAEHLEQSLTSAMERYLTHLHRGRVDPRAVHQKSTQSRQDIFDAAAALRAALAAGRLELAEQQAVPRLPMYEGLREALAVHRALVGHIAWRQDLPPLPPEAGGRSGKLEPGQHYSGLALLAQRLAALGDLATPLPAATSSPDAAGVKAVYDGALVDAVKAFQQRHGLQEDGVVGAATLRQLQVRPAVRVRQIELTLERLRWTPLLQGPRMIVVNVPAFVLSAYEVRDGGIEMRQRMKVIVGKAVASRTPLFDQDLQYIEFSPYWNVPPSIARKELVPRLRRDPGHFEREGYEFVAADGRVSTTLSPAALDAVLAGRQRIRQRPGPKNALGDIKFVFPNSDNIYLHHTPATQLFGRDRRDFSHGCIRVEDPVALARFVLDGMPEWSTERIHEAMTRGTSSTLRLAEPARVLITYGTATVIDGRTFFYDDIYGHDRLLEAALLSQAAQRHTVPASS